MQANHHRTCYPLLPCQNPSPSLIVLLMPKNVTLNEARELQRLTFSAYTGAHSNVPTDPETGRLRPSHADAEALWKLWRCWDEAAERVRILRKVPLPGTLKPGARDGSGRPMERTRRSRGRRPSKGAEEREPVAPMPDPTPETGVQSSQVVDGETVD